RAPSAGSSPPQWMLLLVHCPCRINSVGPPPQSSPPSPRLPRTTAAHWTTLRRPRPAPSPPLPFPLSLPLLSDPSSPYPLPPLSLDSPPRPSAVTTHSTVSFATTH